MRSPKHVVRSRRSTRKKLKCRLVLEEHGCIVVVVVVLIVVVVGSIRTNL